jgi:signal transduction histidine kinase
MKDPKWLNHVLSSEILAGISHELRSPLASIKGYTGTLLRHEERLDPEERREMLQAIDQASNRMIQILDRFLELSQLEIGSIALIPMVIDLPSLLQTTIEEIKERFPTHVHNHYTFSLIPKMETYNPAVGDLQVWADQQRLREVFDHLLENAILYSLGGDIQVTIRSALDSEIPVNSAVQSSHASDAQQRSGEEKADKKKIQQGVETCISDQGIGIPDEALERIFDRFYRTDMRLAREINGLGLGLTICKHLVHLHGGHIWVESEPGKGSAFHVWLPLYTPPKDDKVCQGKK